MTELRVAWSGGGGEAVACMHKSYIPKPLWYNNRGNFRVSKGKVVPVFNIVKHHAMKIYGEVEV
jgi:hypothetical protein